MTSPTVRDPEAPGRLSTTVTLSPAARASPESRSKTSESAASEPRNGSTTSTDGRPLTARNLRREADTRRLFLYWPPLGGVAQLVRAPACHAGGRGFESRRSRSRDEPERRSSTYDRLVANGAETLRPRARILRTFGDELISSGSVAVLELVKNAYDADATAVLVRFRPPLDVGSGGIDIVDNGHGMTTETVRRAFMEPATLHRKQETRSEKLGRRVLGEKGIGRFAVSRLADRLELITRREGAPVETVAIFDWTQFDDPNLYLDQVEVLWEEVLAADLTTGGPLSAIPVAQAAGVDHGTWLRMDDLRVDWREDEMNALRTSLSRLVSPFADADPLGAGHASDFAIVMDMPSPFEHLSGPVGSPEVLRNPPYLLKGTIESDGRYDFTVRIGGDGDELTKTGILKPEDRAAPSCGPLHLELRVWDREADAIRDLANRGQTVKAFRSELDALSGVSIYRDGFRVLPYGERDDDWLRLDLRRVNNPTMRLSNNQVAGYVSITRDGNPSLIDQTNREGLMQNRAYRDLRELVIGAIGMLEQDRYSARRSGGPRTGEDEQRGRQSGRRDPFDAFDLSGMRAAVTERYGTNSDLLPLVDATQENLTEAAGEVRDILSSYNRLAGLGRLVDAILHDGRGPLGSIDSAAVLGLRALERRKHPVDGALAVKLEERLQRVREQAAVLDALFKRIEPFAGRRRGRPRSIIVEDLVRDTAELLHSRLAEVDLRLPAGSTTVTVEETDLRIVLYNLLDNAAYWVRDAPDGARTIEVRVRRLEAGSVEILVSDSGYGVPEEDRDRIFDPYFTRKSDGWGVGLAHAGDILREYYDGELNLVDGGPQSGATFQVLIRRRTG